jgi:hypothetical protein
VNLGIYRLFGDACQAKNTIYCGSKLALLPYIVDYLRIDCGSFGPKTALPV